MSQPFATHCRFCHQPGDLLKGAHKACKNEAYKHHIRIKRGIPPERWTAEVDRKTTCNTCNVRPRNGKSYECVQCKSARVNGHKRISHSAYMRGRRAKIAKIERPCKCGCGRMVTGMRYLYASPACWPKYIKIERPVKAAPKLPANWEKPSKRMKPMFVGTQVQQPAVLSSGRVKGEYSPEVIVGDVPVRRLPSLMPSTLRNPITGILWELEG